jgi:inosine/xanthosine triphosphatase
MNYSQFRYALGTTNEAKRSAVILATGVEPVCCKVPSGVADQPMSEEETIQGAINRAKAALQKHPACQIGLGLEGGLAYEETFTGQWYLISICAAWDGSRLFLGKGLGFPVPQQAVDRIINEGIALGDVIDEWSGTTGSNQQGGAYSLLTADRVRRADVFCQAVLAATTPFVSPLYK